MDFHAKAHSRFLALAQRITYPGLVIEVEHEILDTSPGGPVTLPTFHIAHYLRVSAPEGLCNVTGQPSPWKGRKWRLSQYMTDGEFTATALKAVLTALEHEAREVFKVDGVAIYNSHLDLDKLLDYHRQNAPHGRTPA